MKEIFKFFVLAVLAIGSAPAWSAVWQWSHTAGTNAGADPTINWAEGMSPSSINDSARAMMARTADWRDDISGALATGGTSSAYTLTTNAASSGNGFCTGAAAIPDGTMLAFTPHATNAAAPTLQVDSCTALTISLSSGVQVPSATLVLGTPYRVKYSTAATSWMLEGVYGNPFNVPLGGLLPYTGATAPNSSFILPAGQCISTTTYATYWALMGSPASGGCPGGQFAVIDLRGRVLAALDNLNGSAANRLTTSGCGTAMTSNGAACTSTETFTLATTNLPPYTPSGTVSVTSPTGNQYLQFGAGGPAPPISSSGNGFNNFPSLPATFSGSAQGGVSTPVPRVQPTIGVTYLLRVI